MADTAKQEGVNQSSAGAGGLHSLRNSNRGNVNGDEVDNSQSANPVDQAVNFKRQEKLRNSPTTFRYPPGKSAAQEY